MLIRLPSHTPAIDCWESVGLKLGILTMSTFVRDLAFCPSMLGSWVGQYGLGVDSVGDTMQKHQHFKVRPGPSKPS